MPSWKDLYPDRWLKASTIAGKRVPVELAAVTREKLFNPTSKKEEPKLIARFKGKELRLILNKTQLEVLTKLAGTDDYSRWGGLNLFLSTAIANNGKDTIVITHREQAQAAPQPTAKAEPRQYSADDDVDFDRGTGTPDVEEDSFDGEDDNPWEDEPEPEPTPSARPATSGARPVNNSTEPCPVCHAPVGRPHATTCTAAKQAPAARPEESSARPQASGARPQQAAARPEPSPEDELYDELAHMSSAIYSNDANEFIRRIRNANSDSSVMMSANYFVSLCKMIEGTIFTDGDETSYLLTALLGKKVDSSARPGQLVHGFLMKPLREENAEVIEILIEVLNQCREMVAAAFEGTGENG